LVEGVAWGKIGKVEGKRGKAPVRWEKTSMEKKKFLLLYSTGTFEKVT